MDNNQLIQRYIANIAEARGTIINHVISIERAIDEFLSLHFCGGESKKKSQLFELLSEETTFDIKRKNLARILKSDYPTEYETNKHIFKFLEDLMQARNIFAHWIYDTSDEAIPVAKQNKIQLMRFRASKDDLENIKTYDSDSLNALLRKADSCLLALVSLHKTISNY